jgi:hypothetical protein
MKKLLAISLAALALATTYAQAKDVSEYFAAIKKQFPNVIEESVDYTDNLIWFETPDGLWECKLITRPTVRITKCRNHHA